MGWPDKAILLSVAQGLAMLGGMQLTEDPRAALTPRYSVIGVPRLAWKFPSVAQSLRSKEEDVVRGHARTVAVEPRLNEVQTRLAMASVIEEH